MTDAVSPALELRGVSKRFGALEALRDVDLTVVSGSVHGLLGENGAGKSTLMRIAYGLTPRDTGGVRLFGREMQRYRPAEAIARGVGMVQQHNAIAPGLTAVENLVLGGRGRYRAAAAEQVLRDMSRQSGLAVAPHSLARDLSIVEQQRLEILKALARQARLLILDEPTAVLAPAETDELLRWIRGFADAGGAVVLVTHKLRELLSVADSVTVLRRGRVALHSTTSATSAESLGRAMFPDAVETRAPPVPSANDHPVVKASNVRAADNHGVLRIDGATFEIRSGEIVGLAGAEGSGVRELVQVVAGLRHIAAGQLRLPSSIGFIPADRTHDGLVPDFTLAENVALRGAGSRTGIIDWGEMNARTQALLDDYDVSPRSPRAVARSLSGGNQQRVIIARELAGTTELLVADNPTRGLDLQATEFVLRRLRASAAAGAAVVVHSSDLDELLSIATRMFVVFQTRVREAPLDRDVAGRMLIGAA